MFETIILKPIFNALLLLYSLIPGGDFGVAIILFTIIIRCALHPLVRSQLRQTKRMRKMQPELAKIKKAAKGNKQVEAMQQMELYKKYGIKPFRSILVLLIQLPIFIGLYQVIRIITLHRDQVATFTYDIFEKIGPIQQIIADPNSFNHTMLGFIDLTKVAVSNTGIDVTLIVLAIISAITQYIMTKQTMPTGKSSKKFRDIMKEAAEGREPDQTEMNAVMMNNMMKFMPVMMFFIMISLPGALALFYTVSNLVAVAQQHYLLNKDQEELEEIASTPTTPSSKKAKDRVKNAKEAHVTRIKAKD
ncbi:MAG: YidC/Oxa1 family membrane protein insertase [Rickettsia endosymbiont of Ixodes persulcatus]|nr:YidC/Oxa1 family membrane protein insertase [Rickettsia endosymbiont of Ixodes persulcatus]